MSGKGNSLVLSSVPDLPRPVKLLIGALGIYGSFLYYGALQEDVFDSVSTSGTKFKSAWFLQIIETLANVVVAAAGRIVSGGTPNLPLNLFAVSGATQVFAKAFTSLSLANGVSFPIVTLAKSGKMVPVMIGSLLVGKASYSTKEYLSVLSIIVGTCMVSSGKKGGSGPANTVMGLAFIALSLTCDGLTGGVQNRLKADLSARKMKAQPYDFMMYTNLFMMITAVAVSFLVQDFQSGLAFCLENPIIFEKILKFAVCSAVGQSFIFYTVAVFDPLVCCTITTTRKLFSVFLSIFLHGHQLTNYGWAGLAVASVGVLLELQKEMEKKDAPQHQHAHKVSDSDQKIKQEEGTRTDSEYVTQASNRATPVLEDKSVTATTRRQRL